jgi:phage shock protein PspC (stress-responsive transcriptional regulator)
MNFEKPMKKTHSANIGGTVFQVEEDAYEKLQDYLQSIHTHFNFYPDVADIVADIEGRIAEQLLQREFAARVVQMSDVEHVIEAMGRIEQFDDPATSAAPATGQALPSEGRKLFRDPDHKVIAGVASGLAAYLGLPVLLVRITFLVLLFFFGTALVAYLLIWALAPVAGSTTDRLQMRGRPLNLASIDQGVRDSIASIPTATRSAAAQGITAIGSLIHLVVVTIARAIKWVAGVFVVGVATLGLLFLTVSLVVALVNANAPPLVPGASEFFASFGGWRHAFKVGVYLAAAIPLAVIIATGLKLFWGVNRLNTRGLASLLGVWVVSLLATAAIWSNSYSKVREYVDEYPAMAQARGWLETYETLAATTTSPLTSEQSQTLLGTLVAEHRRRREEHDIRTYPWHDRGAQLDFEQETIVAKEASNQRILGTATNYLDATQLAVIQESMTRDIAGMRANLQVRREQLEAQIQREAERKAERDTARNVERYSR